DREGPEDWPCGAEEEGAKDQARERPRPDQDGIAPFDRTRTAARRDGARPATTAAVRATIRVSPIAPSGGSRITRFGKPKRGAKETTAWATIIPNAAPRTAPAREITEPMTRASGGNVAWICATAARTKPTAPTGSIRVRPNRETIDGARVAFATIAWTDPPRTRSIPTRRSART